MRRVAILIVILGVMAPVSPAARGGQGHGENFVLVEEARLLDIDLVDVDGDGDLDIYKAESAADQYGRWPLRGQGPDEQRRRVFYR